ncbi:unnamed protein product, partial [Brachionus calyciflorus]
MPPNNMNLEDRQTNGAESNKNYTIPKRVAQIGVVLLVLIFIGSIIAAYNAKKIAENLPCTLNASELSQEKSVDCKSIYCDNPFILNDWNQNCLLPSTTKPYTESTKKPIVNYRLPRNLKPYFYEILIKSFFNVTQEPTYYTGHVLIKFKCLKNTSKLIFHKHQNIEIDNLSFELRSSTDPYFIPVIQIKRSNYLIHHWIYNNETQLFEIEFYKDIFVENGDYSMSLGFKSLVKSDNYGIYKSFYNDENGHKKWLLASQMEPIDARKAFPCFDEPNMKSKFKIRILHDASLTPMSNMPVKSVTKIDAHDSGYDWIQTDFYETVEMSTYLVAFLISDFECLTTRVDLKMSANVSVNVCSRPNAKNELNLSLKASVDSLKFFESFYNIKYPLDKLDHVAIPDFSAGAMENWGLILYREARLLYDAKKTSQESEEGIVEVIAHEIAHQWFGNLVSPDWWTDLWLNEGFARYMQIVGTNAIRPEWGMFDQFLRISFSIMELDSVQSSHPISVEVNDPNEINEIFDGITYGKGASIIRMMNYFLGEANFNRGLT